MSAATKSAYDLTAIDAEGNTIDLSKFRGHVSLIVNTSCFEPTAERSYQLLSSIYGKFKDEDVSVLLFPCSQFGNETSAEREKELLAKLNIKDIGTIFRAVDVNGPTTSELYRFLKMSKPGNAGGFIKCNFTVFLVDREGTCQERLTLNVHPYLLEEKLEKYI